MPQYGKKFPCKDNGSEWQSAEKEWIKRDSNERRKKCFAGGVIMSGSDVLTLNAQFVRFFLHLFSELGEQQTK